MHDSFVEVTNWSNNPSTGPFGSKKRITRSSRRSKTYLRKKGTENIDWVELKKQNIVEVPGEEEEGDSNLNWSFILGLGAAALAYLLWKNAKK